MFDLKNDSLFDFYTSNGVLINDSVTVGNFLSTEAMYVGAVLRSNGEIRGIASTVGAKHDMPHFINTIHLWHFL